MSVLLVILTKLKYEKGGSMTEIFVMNGGLKLMIENGSLTTKIVRPNLLQSNI